MRKITFVSSLLFSLILFPVAAWCAGPGAGLYRGDGVNLTVTETNGTTTGKIRDADFPFDTIANGEFKDDGTFDVRGEDDGTWTEDEDSIDINVGGETYSFPKNPKPTEAEEALDLLLDLL